MSAAERRRAAARKFTCGQMPIWIRLVSQQAQSHVERVVAGAVVSACSRTDGSIQVEVLRAESERWGVTGDALGHAVEMLVRAGLLVMVGPERLRIAVPDDSQEFGAIAATAGQDLT